jgi:hypothetical protein
MKKNLTAVEWLVERYKKVGGISISMVQKAKVMEKKQMKDASCPYVGGWEDDEFEYWYNKTYKSEQ